MKPILPVVRPVTLADKSSALLTITGLGEVSGIGMLRIGKPDGAHHEQGIELPRSSALVLQNRWPLTVPIFIDGTECQVRVQGP